MKKHKPYTWKRRNRLLQRRFLLPIVFEHLDKSGGKRNEHY